MRRVAYIGRMRRNEHGPRQRRKVRMSSQQLRECAARSSCFLKIVKFMGLRKDIYMKCGGARQLAN